MSKMPGWREGSLQGILDGDLLENGNGTMDGTNGDTPPNSDNGMENGTKGSLLNVAGYWTVGIFKGVSIVAVPILFVSLTAGVLMKVITISSKIGGK